MDADTFFNYHKALKAIRANEQKAIIEANVYPHLSNKQDRESVTRSLSRAFKTNVSDGDLEHENALEKILEERHGKRRKD